MHIPGRIAGQIANDISAGKSGGSGSAPAAIRGQVTDALQMDYAYATRGVLIGMAIAVGLSFLVALRHPGRQAPDEEQAEAAS